MTVMEGGSLLSGDCASMGGDVERTTDKFTQFQQSHEPQNQSEARMPRGSTIKRCDAAWMAGRMSSQR